MMDARQWQNEAVFLASVWLLVREKGLEYVLAHGDPDGVDFVAKRVLENAKAAVTEKVSDGDAA